MELTLWRPRRESLAHSQTLARKQEISYIVTTVGEKIIMTFPTSSLQLDKKPEISYIVITAGKKTGDFLHRHHNWRENRRFPTSSPQLSRKPEITYIVITVANVINLRINFDIYSWRLPDTSFWSSFAPTKLFGFVSGQCRHEIS
ncbi:hypothetical protein RRG08_059734 [Elysia crispata]|uniref:Uncharacterized protein n=1 Tax=Elysia crispata TaxID=231223 RepID=A0AAE1D1S1_9GAST|nr:hypothetical protein RRG08_059734 [Elysia crispata]